MWCMNNLEKKGKVLRVQFPKEIRHLWHSSGLCCWITVSFKDINERCQLFQQFLNLFSLLMIHTTVFLSGYEYEEFANNELVKLAFQCKENQLSVNVKKTTHIVFLDFRAGVFNDNLLL